MKRHSRHFWFPVLLCGVFSFSWAAARRGSLAEPAISFTLMGPASTTINGSGNELQVTDDGEALTVSVPLAGLKTGIFIRDRYMRERYLQTSMFPTSELRIPRDMLKIPANGASTTDDTTGTLSLHGRRRPVTFHYACTRNASKLRVQGSIRFRMDDFDIEPPALFGFGVAPDVDVSARFELTDE